MKLFKTSGGCVSGQFSSVNVSISDTDCIHALPLYQKNSDPIYLSYVIRLETACLPSEGVRLRFPISATALAILYALNVS